MKTKEELGIVNNPFCSSSSKKHNNIGENIYSIIDVEPIHSFAKTLHKLGKTATKPLLASIFGEEIASRVRFPITLLGLCSDFGVKKIPIDPARWRQTGQQTRLEDFFDTLNEPEKEVKRFYESLGYRVIRSKRLWKLPKDVRKQIKTEIGIPDFFVCNEKERFFVEVKSSKGGLRVSQLEWISQHSEFFKIRVAVVEKRKIKFMTFEVRRLDEDL